MPDAISVLEEDHREVEGLFEQYRASKDPALVEQICTELSVHSALEEGVVYPVLGADVPGGAELRDHAEEEHSEVKGAIARIRQLGYGDPGVEELMETIIEGVTEHVQEEESDVFPKMKQALDRDKLNELGQQLEAAEVGQRRVQRAAG